MYLPTEFASLGFVAAATVVGPASVIGVGVAPELAATGDPPDPVPNQGGVRQGSNVM